jgi:hypothetical protein
MRIESVELSSFERDTSFYGELVILATVKNFDLQAIRDRYLKSKNNKNSLTGSIERRPPSLGGLVSFSLKEGKLHSHEILTEMKEPRGISSHNETLAFSSENEVFILTNGAVKKLKDPWFSYIHTVDFSSDGKRLLVSSSGFDVLLEFDLNTLQRCSEWWAWENGFDEGKDPKTGDSVRLSRVPIEGVKNLKLIQDPEKDVLPTAMRAAFINSAEYDRVNEGFLIATFFHKGAIYSIDTKNGQAKEIISNLKNPHGGMHLPGRYMATSTRSGHVVIQEKALETRYSFAGLDGKPEALEREEWLQNSKVLSDGSILTIDSNRTSFVVFHPEKKVFDMIPYPDNMAVQDMLICTKDQAERWKKKIRLV